MITAVTALPSPPAIDAAPCPLLPGTDRRGLVVAGLGDLFRGDHGAALYAATALEQAGFEKTVRLDYLAQDSRSLVTCLHETRAAAIILAEAVSGRPGAVRVLDLAGLRTLAALDGRPGSMLSSLANMLGLADLAGIVPENLRVILMEPDPGHDAVAASLSPVGRRALRRVVALAAEFLIRHGASPDGWIRERLYRIPWADITF